MTYKALAVGGPLHGRVITSDAPHLAAVVPAEMTYTRGAIDPMADSPEVMHYELRRVTFLHDGLALGSQYWIPAGEEPPMWRVADAQNLRQAAR